MQTKLKKLKRCIKQNKINKLFSVKFCIRSETSSKSRSKERNVYAALHADVAIKKKTFMITVYKNVEIFTPAPNLPLRYQH